MWKFALGVGVAGVVGAFVLYLIRNSMIYWSIGNVMSLIGAAVFVGMVIGVILAWAIGSRYFNRAINSGKF